MWKYTGQERPDFAEDPKIGQESVWDYPRPPALEEELRSILVATLNGKQLASTTSALRLCETASPPQFYIPIYDIDMPQLIETPGASYCEWKGRARYWSLQSAPEQVVGWDYPDVSRRYQQLANHLAFYPGRLDCSVDGEAVVPQPGEFYGGWITPELVGPFKGDPGTGHW